MFATGAVLLPFFSFMSYLIAVPTGIKFFNWIGTMWKGQLTFETPMLFSVGFMVTFLLGGLSGVMLASPPIDFHVTDTYFLVAHFHYVLFGTIVFATFAGIYFWFPKMTGRLLDERLGKLHFWLTLIGFHTTFLVQHWLGNTGMPRRYADYLAHRRLPTTECRLDDRGVHSGCVDASVRVERVQELALRRTRHRRRPLGTRQLPGMGHQLPATAAQLHRAAPHPLGASGIRVALSAHGGTDAGRAAYWPHGAPTDIDHLMTRNWIERQPPSTVMSCHGSGKRIGQFRDA